MHRNPHGYDKAYTKLVDYLLQFALSRIPAGQLDQEYPRTYGSLTGFGLEISEVQIGDLVQVSAMRHADFRLSWVLAMCDEGGGPEHLLKSAKTGEEVWWSNVGLGVFHRHTRMTHPEWRWTNEQIEFNNRWLQAAADCDEYLYRPMQVTFLDDTVAEVRTRERHGLSDYKALRKVLWREITDEQLRELFCSMEKEHKDRPREQKT